MAPQAGMNKDVLLDFVIGLKGIEKIKVFLGKNYPGILMGGYAIASGITVQGFLAAVIEKGLDIPAGQVIQEHMLMIAQKKNR
jgi:hypothetical protein